jgi:hypothetical protein
MADPWLVAIFVAGGAALWLGRRHLKKAAAIVLCIAIGFLSVKGVMLATAVEASHLARGPSRALEARWGSITDWDLYERTPAALRTLRISSRGGPPAEVLRRPLAPESPLVAASRSLDTVKNFLRTHDFGFPVEALDREGRTLVRWSDLRYCRSTEGVGEGIACALWFGGVFAPDGRPVEQEMIVGAWKQTRAVTP